MKFNTKAIHGGQEPDSATGAVMTPIYQSSTFAQESPGKHKGYAYARTSNPTRTALEKAFASIENAEYGFAFSSGIAATDCVMRLLSPGDEVIAGDDLYGGTYRLFTTLFSKYGITFRFVDMSAPENVSKAISSKTALLWLETPTNPLLKITDIAAIAKIAQTHNILSAVDNTFASPYLQQPLDMGVDIVMHSATKYLGGHSDIIMGALMVKEASLAKDIHFIQFAAGAIAGPQDCFLALRGVKTLHLRMQRHSENGLVVARFLEKHPKVAKVYYPGLENHPNHVLAKKQMKAFGGMLSFSLQEGTKQSAFTFLEQLSLFTLAESLGGVESLANHPATMSHGAIPKEEKDALGVTDNLIRLSVGIEDIEDILEDLSNALAHLESS